MPIDPRMVKWDEQPYGIDPRMVKWDSAPSDSQLAETPEDIIRSMPWLQQQAVGAGAAMSNLWQGAKQLVGKSDPEEVRLANIAQREAPVGAFVANAATSALPFGMAGTGLKAAGAVGGAIGMLQPIEGAQSWTDVARGKALNTAIGGAAGAGGQYIANKLLGGVTSKLSSIEQKMQEKAAEVAASETASARSAAGNAAQNAYRQLEHLRELGANRALTEQEKMTVNILERELAEKALDKLIPAAALKQSTSEAYKDAMATEAERAAKYAADKLSGDEVKQQIMARLKRYGPAAVGGALGHMMLPGVGTIGGVAGGLYLRPALRSMINLSRNPAVQHGLLSPIANSSTSISTLLPTLSLLSAEGMLGQ